MYNSLYIVSAVTKFKLGDLAAVGCLVDSDGNCPECQAGLEQFCPHMTLTYNSHHEPFVASTIASFIGIMGT